MSLPMRPTSGKLLNYTIYIPSTLEIPIMVTNGHIVLKKLKNEKLLIHDDVI